MLGSNQRRLSRPGGRPRSPPSPARPPEALAELTERERDILLLVARCLSNEEIADRLVISPLTAKTHVRNVKHSRCVAYAPLEGCDDPAPPVPGRACRAARDSCAGIIRWWNGTATDQSRRAGGRMKSTLVVQRTRL